MLPFKHRLKKKKDFEKVFKQGKGFRQEFLFLKVVENNQQDSRFAFSVSQKVAKNATSRNRMKRVLSEVVKTYLAQVKPGNDVALVVLSDFKDRCFDEVKESVLMLFKKAGIYKK